MGKSHHSPVAWPRRPRTQDKRITLFLSRYDPIDVSRIAGAISRIKNITTQCREQARDKIDCHLATVAVTALSGFSEKHRVIARDLRRAIRRTIYTNDLNEFL